MVEHGVASFEVVPPSVEEIAQRIDATLPRFPYLVAERDGELLGYAYAGQHRAREAYQWSVDVSVYIAPQAHRGGIGRALYERLLAILEAQHFHAAYASIVIPNAASVGLHEALGFRHVGTSPEVGFKHGQWRDVGYWRRPLSNETPPRALMPFAQWREGLACTM
jgi:phosphinothricin acetyltransferase